MDQGVTACRSLAPKAALGLPYLGEAAEDPTRPLRTATVVDGRRVWALALVTPVRPVAADGRPVALLAASHSMVHQEVEAVRPALGLQSLGEAARYQLLAHHWEAKGEAVAQCFHRDQLVA